MSRKIDSRILFEKAFKRIDTIKTNLKMIGTRRYVDHVQQICLMLGPYRNLTTLTAACCHLHPKCVTLNHAGNRVLGSSKLNFLEGPSKDKVDNFCQFALAAVQGGKRGHYGGDITLSHAFDRDMLRKKTRMHVNTRYQNYYEAVVWKESHMVTNILKEADVDRILKADPRIKFLLPVRNPLDTATSNLKAHYRFYPAFRNCQSSQHISFLDILDATLQELAFVASLKHAYPDRVFILFQFDVDSALLMQLAEFLGLNSDPEWIRDVLDVWDTPHMKYEYSSEEMRAYRAMVAHHFPDGSTTKAQLLRFADL